MERNVSILYEEDIMPFLNEIQKVGKSTCYISYDIFNKLLYLSDTKLKSKRNSKVSIKWKKHGKINISFVLSEVYNKVFQENVVRIDKITCEDETLYDCNEKNLDSNSVLFRLSI